jgi:hypothetical protein
MDLRSRPFRAVATLRQVRWSRPRPRRTRCNRATVVAFPLCQWTTRSCAFGSLLRPKTHDPTLGSSYRPPDSVRLGVERRSLFRGATCGCDRWQPGDLLSIRLSGTSRKQLSRAARCSPRLHDDLRLEVNGVFKSWAVTKGHPLTLVTGGLQWRSRTTRSTRATSRAQSRRANMVVASSCCGIGASGRQKTGRSCSSSRSREIEHCAFRGNPVHPQALTCGATDVGALTSCWHW